MHQYLRIWDSAWNSISAFKMEGMNVQTIIRTARKSMKSARKMDSSIAGLEFWSAFKPSGETMQTHSVNEQPNIHPLARLIVCTRTPIIKQCSDIVVWSSTVQINSGNSLEWSCTCTIKRYTEKQSNSICTSHQNLNADDQWAYCWVQKTSDRWFLLVQVIMEQLGLVLEDYTRDGPLALQMDNVPRICTLHRETYIQAGYKQD